ncbi:hypothetical protein HW555_012645 [Spodoptera exigua]|uniref:MADF domain-containing protein n=1 Tax=Spodoptera exigua TaxID=7107 RepID=A0A835L3D8_SPOEX|nr:hypothetical protein HW555_012645 [Spodoptera exigua]
MSVFVRSSKVIQIRTWVSLDASLVTLGRLHVRVIFSSCREVKIMNWNNENVIKFIEAYKEKQVLWDPSHKSYYNRNLKQEAWDELSVEMECPVGELKKKMDYLLAANNIVRAKSMLVCEVRTSRPSSPPRSTNRVALFCTHSTRTRS